MKQTFLSLVFTIAAITIFAQPNSAGRSVLDPAYEPFYHGVASGDPLPDRVILWTRITTSALTENVTWQIATDVNFNNVVNSGAVTTDDTKDFTVKVDAAGLQANTWYYYRFNGQGKYSITGRTRTAPTTGVTNLRFAVLSCSNLPNGYFHAYRNIVDKNEVDAVLHLGDYIYEYKTNSAVPNDTTRKHEPDNEILTLADYRMRHSQYKLDADLRECHRQFPFICVWDDHETTNNSWKGGADNHTQGTEGNWYDRKGFGIKAYFEWMPLRPISPTNDSSIYRTLSFGNLADVIMVDTRLEGRDQQAPGILVQPTHPIIKDSTRSLFGAPQLTWFNDQLKNSTATWKIVGNQVMVAPLTINALIVNPDQWDGYPFDRKKVFDNILGNDIKNVVFLTGDIHTSWANDVPYDRSIYNPSTGAGSAAVEFVCTSVTSGSEINVSAGIVQSANPHMKYIDLSKRGYVLLDITASRTQGDWIHVSDITKKSFTASVSASWAVNLGERFLRMAVSPIATRSGMPNLATAPTSVGNIIKTDIVSLMCYPNPFTKEIQLQYYLFEGGNSIATVFDKRGRKVFEQALPGNTIGLHEANLQLEKLSKGNYIVQIVTPKGTIAKEIIKVQ